MAGFLWQKIMAEVNPWFLQPLLSGMFSSDLGPRSFTSQKKRAILVWAGPCQVLGTGTGMLVLDQYRSVWSCQKAFAEGLMT